ncbi:MAG: sulfite exporter TauE/SafE family protein [Kofleriaceae bacterium]
MIAILTTVFVTSLAGSLHCLAMCGPLVGLVGEHSLRLSVIHALGRLVTYAMFGAIAGLAGGAVNIAGSLGSVQHAATIIAGAIIVGLGARTIAIARGWWTPRRGDAPAFTRGLVRLRRRRPIARAWIAGALTGLVPCGWLWAFVVSAAGTGSALAGAALMSVFWLGTVPAMTGLLALAGPIVDRLRRRIPVVAAVTLIVLGVGTLAMRWDATTVTTTTHACHEVMR